MPLTPADVHNVAFSKPPIGKRGYNEDEVDAFLDASTGGGSTAMHSEPGGELRVEVAMAGRSFPSMYFDPRLLRRLAAAGMSLRITTAPRAGTSTSARARSCWHW